MPRGDQQRFPLVWLAPGTVADPRGLLRHGSLAGVLVPVGPLVAEHEESTPPARHPGRAEPGGTGVGERGDAPDGGAGPRCGVGGLEHDPARGVGPEAAVESLRWVAGATPGLRAVLAVRAGTPVDLVDRVCRSVSTDLQTDAGTDGRTAGGIRAVAAVEVDLRGLDDQGVRRTLSRLREAIPTDLLVLARLSALQPDLVAVARAAVAGGAGAVVACGSVPMPGGRWWSGPSTAALTRAGVRALAEAGEQQRWPAVPVVASGGVHGIPSARAAMEAGAAALALGTALWADPTLLHRIRDDLEERR